MIKGEAGLYVTLSREYPTIIKVGDKEIRIFTVEGKGVRAIRIEADESVRIIGPHLVKKILSST